MFLEGTLPGPRFAYLEFEDSLLFGLFVETSQTTSTTDFVARPRFPEAALPSLGSIR